jgi:hypothetical protein
MHGRHSYRKESFLEAPGVKQCPVFGERNPKQQVRKFSMAEQQRRELVRGSRSDFTAFQAVEVQSEIFSITTIDKKLTRNKEA